MFQFVTYGFRMWLPKFMLTSFAGTTPASVGFHSVFWLYAGAFIGVMAGGRWSDAVYGHRPVIRFEIPFIGFLACAPLSLAVAYSPSPALCGLAVFVFGFATGFYDSNLFTSLFEVVHPRYRAAAVGLFCLGGAIFGGALGPFVLGWLSASFSIRLAIASLAAFALVGAATILAVRCLTFGNDRIGHDGRNVARGS